MKTVFELCIPRDDVYVDSSRDDVLDLSNLVEKTIDVEKFFDETFETSGMKALLDAAFGRFNGTSPTGVIKLTQAMGGGKTHCMLTLALLAEHPEYRKQFLGNDYADIDPITVVAFTGRESDAPYGIWGSIAQQLGKEEVFKDYYSPLKAPGQSAWTNLLQGQNILILFDELPPYLENAKSISVGNSDLSQVTCTALANLFSAVGKEQLAHVCIVFSDLKATYEAGSELLQSSFKELEHEADRSALNVEPVGLNSDEIYDILKKRLFKSGPAENSGFVNDIALEYNKAVEKARQSGLTNMNGSHLFTGIKESYPFHPSIKDLYARFKENPNFQQTRGMIRLMRQIIRRFYEDGKAQKKYLINVFDVDLNDTSTRSHILQIKPSLDVAINHDIAQNGSSVAEEIDAQSADKKMQYAQNFCKLLFMSSLNDVTHGLVGLSEQEAIGYLCEPGCEINSYKQAFAEIRMQSWYLKQDNRGQFYFQNQKNLVAEMNTLVASYSMEGARKELTRFLNENFMPKRKCCYENLAILPALDEIKLDQDKITLVIAEPYQGSQLNPDVKAFYDNCSYKNRVMFLTGQRSLMNTLIENSKKLTAIRTIISAMKAEHVSETDQQYKAAESQQVQVLQALLSTIRETFTTLYFPMGKENKLRVENFKLEFSENSFKGEDQIIKVLTESQKFSDWQTSDDFLTTMQNKCERRLFTQKELPWSTIRSRAATETNWGWYHPGQMEELKRWCINRDLWREQGGYMIKGPFEKEPTYVIVTGTVYSYETQKFTYMVHGGYGDVIYWEIGGDPTTASNRVKDDKLDTEEPAVSFLCVDSSGEHPTGEVKQVLGKATLKYQQRTGTQGQILEIQTHPKYSVQYTTDGSNARENGGRYTGEIALPDDCQFVNVYVSYKGQEIEYRTIQIDRSKINEEIKIDAFSQLDYVRKGSMNYKGTSEVYQALSNFKKVNAMLSGGNFMMSLKSDPDNYYDVSYEKGFCKPDDIEMLINTIRNTFYAEKEINLEMSIQNMRFKTGKDFNDWVENNKYDLNELRSHGDILQ